VPSHCAYRRIDSPGGQRTRPPRPAPTSVVGLAPAYGRATRRRSTRPLESSRPRRTRKTHRLQLGQTIHYIAKAAISSGEPGQVARVLLTSPRTFTLRPLSAVGHSYARFASRRIASRSLARCRMSEARSCGRRFDGRAAQAARSPHRGYADADPSEIAHEVSILRSDLLARDVDATP
jgi:hypothetical protein